MTFFARSLLSQWLWGGGPNDSILAPSSLLLLLLLLRGTEQNRPQRVSAVRSFVRVGPHLRKRRRRRREAPAGGR